MSLWIIIVLSIIIFFILSMVLIPFFKKTREAKPHASDSEAEQEKERVFAQLSDLEYDYHMKKITNEDYEKVKMELTAKAATMLHSEDGSKEQLEQEVDEEIGQYLSEMSPSGKEYRS